MARFHQFLLGFAIVATLVGCSASSTGSVVPGSATAASGGASAPVAASASVEPSTVTVPEGLRGTWTAAVAGTTSTPGTWTLDITATDLRLTNPNSKDSFSIGPTKVTTSDLTVWADADCPDQTSVTDGTYRLSLKGDQLTFALIADSCGDRSSVLIAKPWTRKP